MVSVLAGTTMVQCRRVPQPSQVAWTWASRGHLARCRSHRMPVPNHAAERWVPFLGGILGPVGTFLPRQEDGWSGQGEILSGVKSAWLSLHLAWPSCQERHPDRALSTAPVKSLAPKGCCGGDKPGKSLLFQGCLGKNL